MEEDSAHPAFYMLFPTSTSCLHRCGWVQISYGHLEFGACGSLKGPIHLKMRVFRGPFEGANRFLTTPPNKKCRFLITPPPPPKKCGEGYKPSPPPHCGGGVEGAMVFDNPPKKTRRRFGLGWVGLGGGGGEAGGAQRHLLRSSDQRLRVEQALGPRAAAAAETKATECDRSRGMGWTPDMEKPSSSEKRVPLEERIRPTQKGENMEKPLLSPVC